MTDEKEVRFTSHQGVSSLLNIFHYQLSLAPPPPNTHTQNQKALKTLTHCCAQKYIGWLRRYKWELRVWVIANHGVYTAGRYTYGQIVWWEQIYVDRGMCGMGRWWWKTNEPVTPRPPRPFIISAKYPWILLIHISFLFFFFFIDILRTKSAHFIFRQSRYVSPLWTGHTLFFIYDFFQLSANFS